MIDRFVRASAPLLLVCAHLTAAETWKVAGPPPTSWQRDRLADLAAHRKAAMQELGDKSVLILFAAEPRNYAGDVDWPYRQENDFFYLTAIPQPGSALVLIPGASKVREILFMPPSNPAQESWTGHILTTDEARKISGIQEVWDARRLNEFLRALLPPAHDVFPDPAERGGGGRGARLEPAPPIPFDIATEFRTTVDRASKGDLKIYMVTRGAAGGIEYRREAEIAAKLHALSPAIDVQDPNNIFTALRRVKSAREQDILSHAVDITAEAFERVYALAVPGTPEYEIQAQFEFTFLRRNSHWGYPCIVASGVNATTLHYETNKDTMKDGDLLLVDDAAEFDGYSVDVTRTIPVNGKFSREQAEIYRLVWDAQQAGISKVLPGHASGRAGSGADTVWGAAAEIFRKGLLKLGLITDPNSNQQLGIWFNHGIGHSIGLNVHDPGGPELQPGMVVTVEPGIYIRPDALDNLPKTPENEKFIAAVRPAFEKYKGIGVRIEDDVMVTTGGPKVLSAGIPSKLEDVEAAVAQLRKQVKAAPLP
jgi:Xaa-Pro aminopeptidase